MESFLLRLVPQIVALLNDATKTTQDRTVILSAVIATYDGGALTEAERLELVTELVGMENPTAETVIPILTEASKVYLGRATAINQIVASLGPAQVLLDAARTKMCHTVMSAVWSDRTPLERTFIVGTGVGAVVGIGALALKALSK